MHLMETSKVPLTGLLHILFACVLGYMILALFPTLLPIYRILLLSLIFVMLVVDTVVLLSKQHRYFRITNISFSMLIGITFIIFMVYYISKFMVIAEYKGLENVLLEYGSMAKFLFFLLCMAQPIILPLPEALTIPAGSVAFGAFPSFYLGFSGTLTGIIIMFFIARYGGIKVASKLVKEKHLKRYQEYVRKNEAVILALLFIIPVLPDEIICVGAGIGAVSFKRFLLIASLSKLLTSFVLAYSVSLAKFLDLTSAQLLLSCSVIMGIVFFATFAFNKYWNRKRMEM